MALLNSAPGKQPVSNNMDLVTDMGEDNETMNGEDQPDAGEDDETEGDEPTVLCTVLMNSDGSYSLVVGDEPDEIDGLAVPEGVGPAEGGTPALPEGQTFDAPGPLLKAILDLLRKTESENGTADDQANFEAGYESEPRR